MRFFRCGGGGILGRGKKLEVQLSFLEVYENNLKNCLLDFKVNIYEKYLVKYHENTLKRVHNHRIDCKDVTLR